MLVFVFRRDRSFLAVFVTGDRRTDAIVLPACAYYSEVVVRDVVPVRRGGLSATVFRHRFETGIRRRVALVLETTWEGKRREDVVPRFSPFLFRKGGRDLEEVYLRGICGDEWGVVFPVCVLGNVAIGRPRFVALLFRASVRDASTLPWLDEGVYYLYFRRVPSFSAATVI